MKFLQTEKIIEKIDFQEFESLTNLKKIPKDLSEVSKKTNASYLVDGNIMQKQIRDLN